MLPHVLTLASTHQISKSPSLFKVSVMDGQSIRGGQSIKKKFLKYAQGYMTVSFILGLASTSQYHMLSGYSFG